MKKMLKVFGIILTALVVFTINAEVEAASVLSADVDLKGYDSVIKTQEDGSTLLTNKKGEYVLDGTSSIYSSKSIKITLSNTGAAKIQSINVKGDLYFRGDGELNVFTTEEVGIQVTGYFKPFYETNYGAGKITTDAAKIGLSMKKELRMKGGSLEATGAEYGIYAEDDIKTYNGAILEGKSLEGTGIYAYRGIYTYKGARIYGEGAVAGARAVIGYIQAEDDSSAITGLLSGDQAGEFSALHTDKKVLRAYKGAVVREEYRFSDVELEEGIFNNLLTSYPQVARNLKKVENYTWVTVDADGLETPIEVIDGSLSLVDYEASVIKGSRNTTAKGEVTQLKTSGSHEVLFTGFVIEDAPGS